MNEIIDRDAPEYNAPKISILDHGYIQFIEPWGSDRRIIEAARESTDKGFLGWNPGPCPACGGTALVELCKFCEGRGKIAGDAKLLAFLYSNHHSTPFEMAGMIIEIQAPIFVFREWHRHRTQSYNEMSGRYTPLPDLNYIPTVERLMLNSKTNKQAGTVKGAEELTEPIAYDYLTLLGEMYEEQEGLYQHALRSGIPKELARIHLPVGRYSRMRASANLRNWLGFLTLRMDEKAQWEIRQYANEVCNLIDQYFPRTHRLFVEGRG